MLTVDIERHVGDFHLRPVFEAANELVVLFGPSGCGKSLTLQSVAGLLTPERGCILLPQDVVAFDASTNINIPPQQRNVGYVVQELALFPHMTAGQNIEFALGRWPKSRRSERVRHLIGLLGLNGLEDRRPGHLSGGQQQRVAIARALAAEPTLLLLDEPFTALDAPLRATLRREVTAIRRRLDLTALFVTHDLAEANAMADRIVVLDEGAVLQQGPRTEVLSQPASRRVAELTDVRNIIPGEVIAFAERTTVVRTPWFTTKIGSRTAPASRNVFICIRPEHILLARPDHEAHPGTDAIVEAEIIEDVPLGNTHRLFMRTIAGSERQEPLVLEIDVPAHPYEVLGVASRPQWNVRLTSEHIALVARE